MKTIPLSRGKFAIVDDSDYGLVSRYKWSYATVGYAFRRMEGKCVYLHRFLARIKHSGKMIHLGRFAELSDALAARAEAEEKYYSSLGRRK